MRRIFGGASLTTSSTSNSLSSDALPSPGLPPDHQQGSSTAYLGQNATPAATPPVAAGGGNTRSWFESALTGVVGSRGAANAPTSHDASHQHATTSPGGETTDDDEYVKLPFGSSRIGMVSPPPSNRLHQRHLSRASMLSASTGTAAGGERDELMAELLSGQAVVDAKDYQILDWDDFTSTKKAHALLATRIASLSRSVALKTKLRDTSARMVRLSVPGTPEHARAVDDLAKATREVDDLSSVLHKNGWEESELHTKLLRHTAAVLAAAVKRAEGSQTESNGRSTPFEGAHFFAGNREAILPRAPMSPSLGASVSHAQAQEMDDIRALAEDRGREVNEVKGELGRVRMVEDELRRDKEALQDELATLRTEVATSTRASESDREEVENLRRDLVEARRKLDALQQEFSEVNGELENATRGTNRDVEAAEQRAESAEGRLIEAEDDVARTRAELEAAREEIESLRASQEHERSTVAEASSAPHLELVQGLGDVLRRHRTRAPILRDLSAFDDTDPEVDVSKAVDDHLEMLTHHSTTLEADLRSAVEQREKWRAEAEAIKRRTTSLEQQLETLTEEARAHEEQTKVLSELWRALPPLESRQAASNSDDLAVLRSAFEAQRRPLGNSSSDVEGAPFSVDGLSERIKVLLTEDTKLVQKLQDVEKGRADFEKLKEESEKAEKARGESSANSEALQKQVTELEERNAASVTQEVQYLERLNDLTEGVERIRGEKRKLETSLSSVQAQLTSSQGQIASLEAEKAKLASSLREAQAEIERLSSKPDDSARVEDLEGQITDFQDQLADLESELADAKKREQKNRAQLLDQLSEVESENSSLKTQLRQAQRKKA